jgi:hypothetical protein
MKKITILTIATIAALLLAPLAALKAAVPPDDQRLTGYVHDTSIYPFIVSGKGKNFPDPEPVYRDGVWHLYSMGDGPHFTSTDLVKWVEHEGTGVRGATGCVVSHDGKYYRFYTDPTITIRVVVSDNPWKFDPSKSQLAAEPDGTTYRKGWFRDAYVFFNEDERLWWMLIEGRCPEVCTGLFKSKDLLAWTQCDPVLKDKSRRWGSCPQMFKQGNLWYLSFQDMGNAYYTAEHPNGPWTYRGQYVDMMVEAARLATDGKRHISWGWLCNGQATPPKRIKKFGGPMSVGREIVFNTDGTMGVRPIPELVAAIRNSESKVDLFACARKVSGEWKIEAAQQTLQCQGESGGTVLLDLPEKNPHCYFEAEVEIDSPKASANVVVRSSATADRGYGFALSPADKKITIRDVTYSSDRKILNERECAV